MIFEDDFLRGQKDCAEEFKHITNQGSEYDRGYAEQYEKEQVESELTKDER